MKEKCDICLIEKENVECISVGNVGITQFVNVCKSCKGENKRDKHENKNKILWDFL